MRVFISWSGSGSKAAAEALHEWLPPGEQAETVDIVQRYRAWRALERGRSEGAERK